MTQNGTDLRWEALLLDDINKPSEGKASSNLTDFRVLRSSTPVKQLYNI